MRALDCCAGAGGLSLGLHRAGFDVLGVELDADACETHRRNVGPCELASLWDYSPTERYDLVAGGIPCQSHSMAGKRGGTCDPRGQLYVPFLRIAQEAGARAVLIENVRGMLTSPSATHGTALLEIVAAIKAAGFEHTTHRVLDAADYGVPQRRHRLFIVGFRSAEDQARFEWPRATHCKDGGWLFGAQRWVSVREALGLGRGQYEHGRLAHAKQNSWQGMRVLDVDAPAPTDGGRTADLLDKPAPTIKTRFDEGEDKARPSRRPTAELRKALAALNQPAPCVTATEYKSANTFGSEGAKTGPRRCGDQLNPLLTELARDSMSTAGAVRVTVAQLAALQSFPSGFEFVGTKKSQHRQVGNAVPAPLAEAVGRAVFVAIGGAS